MIAIKYFGAVAEKTRSQGEGISFSDLSLHQLVASLEEKYELNSISFSVAVNQKIVQDTANYMLKSNDIVALLPPFAGG